MMMLIQDHHFYNQLRVMSHLLNNASPIILPALTVIPKLVTLTLYHHLTMHVGKLKYTFPSTQYNSL